MILIRNIKCKSFHILDEISTS